MATLTLKHSATDCVNSSEEQNTMSDSLSRSRRACQECNRKKTKCDMQRPICGLCQRTATDCTFPTKRRTPPIRKSQPQTQSQRVNKRLERLLQLLEASPVPESEPQNRGRRESVSLISESAFANSARIGQPDIIQLSHLEQSTRHSHTRREAGETPPIPPIAHPEPESPVFSPESTVSQQLSQSGMTEGSQLPASFAVSYDLAMHLIDLFFDKIQPWLPLLHKPSFCSRYADCLQRNEDSLQGLPVDEALLLHGVFGLSARYSALPEFAGVPPFERGERFFAPSRVYYTKTRDLPYPSMSYLQGCILISFWNYTSDRSSQGWIAVGLCVRLAYELGLSEIDDDEDAGQDMNDRQSPDEFSLVQKEEMRRAWWLVWELDTFGSLVSGRPYAVDRRRMRVKLPINDDAWFCGLSKSSSEMIIDPGQSWKSLQGCDNQDERAWFLVANHLMGRTHECFQQKKSISEDELMVLENEISCFKLCLPSKFRLTQDNLVFNSESSTRCQWVISVHLMLVTTSFMVSVIIAKAKDEFNPNQRRADLTSAIRTRARELSRIIGLWPPDYISQAYPFLACTLLPLYVDGYFEEREPSISSSNKALLSLVMARFGEYWKLGRYTLRLVELLEAPGALSSEDLDLVRRFAAFFPHVAKIVKCVSAKSNAQQQRNKDENLESLPISTANLQGSEPCEPSPGLNYQADFSMHSHGEEGQVLSGHNQLSFMSMNFESPILGHAGQALDFSFSPIGSDFNM